ncbi:hypothetical protein QBC40DRAFT_249183 [Triangularia verruculosa]|uniref:Uncharacterized protein n=1 Tax=Triangularia verruculosa TaxID=2587418 RepID=A0AAN7AXM8_9PEZI|nr:hypothetical protein QBC40DRAFT_249183 [Triangularia verruculosa]
MEDHVEFYQTTCWAFKPKAIKKIVNALSSHPVTNGRVEALYDLNQRWFKITCHKDEVAPLRRCFAAVASEIEKDAFGSHYERVLGPSGCFSVNIDNDWIADEQQYLSLLNSQSDDFQKNAFPTDIANYPFKTCWDALECRDDDLKLHHILSDEKLAQIEQETHVRIFTDMGKSLVYIGSQEDGCVDKATGKLDVLLNSKNMFLLSLRCNHVLFVDDYVDPILDPEFMVEFRYMTNINPRLTSSTLLDPATVRRLDGAYSRLYTQGVSLRLCPFSHKKKHHVSLLGPHIPAGKTQPRYILGNRPIINEKDSDERPITGPVYQGAASEEAQVAATENQVVTWMEGISTKLSSSLLTDSASVKPFVHPFDLERAALGSLIDIESPSGLDEVALNAPVLPSEDIGNASAPAPITMTGDVEDCGSQGSRSSVSSLIAFSDDDGEPASISTPGPTTDKTTNQATDKTANTNAATTPIPTPFRRYDDPHTKPFHTMNQQAAPARQAVSTSSATSRASVRAVKRSSNTTGAAALGERVEKVPSAEGLDQAIGRLLHKAPCRRGWLEVRAELGRILLGNFDESTLSFNSGQSLADGWKSKQAVYRLEYDSQNLDMTERRKDLRFTKVLTTHGSDAEALLGMWNGGRKIWDPEPRKAEMTYAFHCEMRRKGEEESYRFAIEVRDNGANSSPAFSIMVKPFHPIHDGDGVAPVYVHALKHNWDVRIMLSHVDHDEVDKRASRFAELVYKSLQIRDNNGPNLIFNVPNYSTTVEAVRVLTRWYYPSIDRKSELQITEVEQLDMVTIEDIPNAAPGEKTKRIHARPRLPKDGRIRQRHGDFERWYEAAVLSTQLQEFCQMNASLKLGDSADWSAEDIYRYEGFTNLYGPALAMVRQMDLIGQYEDNNLSGLFGVLLQRANDGPPGVPGSATASSQPSQPNRHNRGSSNGTSSGQAQSVVSVSTAAASTKTIVRNERGEAGEMW